MVKSHLVRPTEWPIQRAADTLSVTISVEAKHALGAWLDRLVEWNQKLDLTAARSVDELVDLMVADALVLSREIPEGSRVVDVGTGAGAPGLALALVRPDLALTLVEPLVKRVSFMRTVIGAAGTSNIHIVHGRGETLAHEFDVAVSRATLPPEEWLRLGSTLAPSVWVLLARESDPGLAGYVVSKHVDYMWPLTGVARHAVMYESDAPA